MKMLMVRAIFGSIDFNLSGGQPPTKEEQITCRDALLNVIKAYKSTWDIYKSQLYQSLNPISGRVQEGRNRPPTRRSKKKR